MAESSEFQQIRMLLLKLPDSEKVKLASLLKSQGFDVASIKASGKKTERFEATLLYDAIAGQVSSVTGARFPPFNIQPKKTKDSVEKATTYLLDFYGELNNRAGEVGDGQGSRALLIAFFNLYAEQTIEFLRELRIPVSVGTVANMHQKYPGILDAAFPGYTEAGAFFFVLQQRRSLAT